MLQVTVEQKDKFEEAMRDDNRKLAYRIKIDDKVVLLKQLKSQMVITTDGGFEEYHVGYALTSSLEFYTKKEFEMTSSSYVDIEVGLEVENGGNYEIVYLPFQRFYLYDSEIKGMERKVKCYDYMYKLASKGYFPSAKHQTTAAVCQDMSQQLGIEFKGVQNVTIYSEELEGRTYKEILGYLASAMGCNVRIARDNKIEFFGLTTTHLTFTPREYKTPTLNESTYQVTCLEVHYGEKKTGENGEVLDEGYYRVGEYTTKAGLLTFSNPLLKNQREVALRVLNKLKELRYTRFETSISLADYRLEIGDMVSFQMGESKVTVPLLYTQYTLVYDNVILSLKSPTKSQEKKEYSFQGTLTQKVNAVYTDLIQVKTLVAEKVSVEQLEAEFAKIENLYVKEAEIDQLVAGSIAVQDLQANIANINVLVAGKADISELNAAVANINILNANLADIKHLVSGHLSAENMQVGGITFDRIQGNTVVIVDAMIQSVNANKIKAGQIDTTLVNVTSSSGNLVIQDNTIQIRDANRVRVQIGKDASNDYSMSVWDSSGKLMFDARGLKADAIKDSIIRNDMISTNANIDGSKLNINSVVSSINQGSSLLKASKVQIDGVAQTLEVAFNILKTQADGTKSQTESNTTAINVAQGKINTLIQDTTITKDGVTTTLKDEYSRLEQTISGINTVVGKQQTVIDDHTGKITATNSELSSLSQSVNGLTASVSSAQTQLQSHATQIGQKANSVEVYTKSQTDAQISLAKESINLVISSTYETKTNVETKVTTAVNGIQVGGRNLVLNSDFSTNTYWSTNENAAYTNDGKDGKRAMTIQRSNWNGSAGRTGTSVSITTIKEVIPKGTGFTLSAWVYVDGSITLGDNSSSIFFRVWRKDNDTLYDVCNLPITQSLPKNTWIKLEHSNTASYDSKPYVVNDGTSPQIGIYVSKNGKFRVSNIKLEKGTKATDWTPAPEDIQATISSTKTEVKEYTDSQINIAKTAITQSVASTYETKTDATSKINGVNSSISSLQTRMSNAEQKITDTAITNLVKQNFYTKEETNTQITSKGYQTASQVQQTVDNIAFNFQESGGYNLLMNTSFKNGLTHWVIGDAANGSFSVQSAASNTWAFPTATVDTAQIVVHNKTNVWSGLVQEFDTIINQDYTLSVYIACHRVIEGWVAVRDMGGTWVGSHRIEAKPGNTGGTNLDNWERVIIPFKAITHRYNIIVYVVNAGENAHLWFAQPQVAVGTKLSPYSPNPNEVYSGQTKIDKTGIRVDASNVGTYTEMHAGGFFVKKNDGNLLFEATNKIALYNGKGVSCVEIVNDPSAAYGNAMINVRGGINFLHKPGQSTGTNGIQLGNHDVSNQYGMHNLSIRCWNSLGFSDNNNSTNMFADVRRGRWIMKGAVYQNAQTPPSMFSMNFDGEDEVYNSGFTRDMAVASIMNLKTGVYVDNDGQCCSAIYGGHDELITTEYQDEDGIVTTHLNTNALNASLVVTCQEQQRVIEALQKELNEIKEYLNVA